MTPIIRAGLTYSPLLRSVLGTRRTFEEVITDGEDL
jgi:hypothetical protein